MTTKKDDLKSLDERALLMTTGGFPIYPIVSAYRKLGNGIATVAKEGSAAAATAPQGA